MHVACFACHAIFISRGQEDEIVDATNDDAIAHLARLLLRYFVNFVYYNTFANGWLEISSGGVVFGVVPLVFGSCRSLILRS